MSLKKFAPHLLLTTHKPTPLYALFVCALLAISFLLLPVAYNVSAILAIVSLGGLAVFMGHRLSRYQPDELHLCADTLTKNGQVYTLEAVHYYFSAVIVLNMRDEQGKPCAYQITRWHVLDSVWRELIVYVRLRAMYTT